MKGSMLLIDGALAFVFRQMSLSDYKSGVSILDDFAEFELVSCFASNNRQDLRSYLQWYF